MFGTAMSVHNIFSILSFFALGVLWYAISVIRNSRLWYSKASLIAQRFLVVFVLLIPKYLYVLL